MKKCFKFLVIPIFITLILCGCSGKLSILDVQKTYNEMTQSFDVDEKSIFFNNEDNPYAISIAYSHNIKEAINKTNASNDLQKRYRSLYYQQAILNNIFDFYNMYQEEFYRIAESKDLDKKEVENLYEDVQDLNQTLNKLTNHYETFTLAVSNNGVSDIMEFNITSYIYNLNNVIDKSFVFIYDFYDIYTKYCVEDITSLNETNLKLFVNKAYIDLSYIVYLDNIKSFNYSVGSNGVCDFSSAIDSSNRFSLLSLLEDKKSLSTGIVDQTWQLDEQGAIAKEKVEFFIYQKNVFDQKLQTFLKTYYNVDVYQLNQYRFNLNETVDYDSYLNSLSNSKKSTIIMLDNFINDTFLVYVNKLMTIVE